VSIQTIYWILKLFPFFIISDIFILVYFLIEPIFFDCLPIINATTGRPV